MIRVFIDGKEGTTGLKIYERFEGREDIVVLQIPDEHRKSPEVRRDYINEADVTFLCLPDVAAIESVSLVAAEKKFIDASTAHRTNPVWAYGFPELSSEYRAQIENATRVAVPGCHAAGFSAIVYPLRKLGVLSDDYPLVCHSLTGYSGGGKGMIADYECVDHSKRTGAAISLNSPRQYGVTQEHKHLKEMTHVCELRRPPLFSPIVADFFSGMETTIPLYAHIIGLNARQVHEALSDWYASQTMVSVLPFSDGSFGGFLAANQYSGRNDMKLFVSGGDERILISALFDNLGKGASGAAVQCMNIMFGVEETKGLL